MTRAEALRLVARMRSAWPHAEFPEETAVLYVGRLERYALEEGVVAVERMIDSCGFLPSVAEMLSFVEAAHREVERRRPAIEQAPGVPPPPAVLAEWRKTRAALAARSDELKGS